MIIENQIILLSIYQILKNHLNVSFHLFISMKKLINKSRQVQIMAKLLISLQKFDNFKQPSQIPQNQKRKQLHSNQQLTKKLSKLLESNQKKKNELKQNLVSGIANFDFYEQMNDVRQRIDILRQHRSQRQAKSYDSLTGKQSNYSAFANKFQNRTFDELYSLQKQKFSELRERRKAKRLSLSYIDTIANKEGRKQRNKQRVQEKFTNQMKQLEEVIDSR